MIFTKEHVAFHVLDVLRIEQNAPRRISNARRHFCALSFREKTDAVLTTKDQELEMQADSVTFFPADLDYVREANVDHMTVFHFEMYNCTEKWICSVQPVNSKKVGALFAQAWELWQKGGPSRGYQATAILNEIFGLLYDECIKNDSEHPPLLQKALRFIEQNYADPDLTVAVVAEHCHVCQAHLRRVFRQEFQSSPLRYINDLRLRRAAALLASGYYTVAEVAFYVGFRDEKYFSTLFRKQMDVPPSQYRYQFNK